MPDEWIVVPNWNKFQHYKNRNPTWIKLYTELMSDDAFLGLTFHQRGVLVSIWLEYATSHRQMLGNTAALSRRLGGRVTRATLEALNHAGFIAICASAEQTVLRTEELDKEADSRASARLPFKKSNEGQNHSPSGNVVERLLTEIRDANNRTRDVIHKFEGRLPDAAFATALESLRERRRRPDRKPLVSEARYVVAALTSMEREGQYAR